MSYMKHYNIRRQNKQNPAPKLQCFSPVPFAALGELPRYTPCIFLFFKKILMQLMWQGPHGEQDEIPCQKRTLLRRDTVLEVPGSQLNNALARIKHPDPPFLCTFQKSKRTPSIDGREAKGSEYCSVGLLSLPASSENYSLVFVLP